MQIIYYIVPGLLSACAVVHIYVYLTPSYHRRKTHTIYDNMSKKKTSVHRKELAVRSRRIFLSS